MVTVKELSDRVDAMEESLKQTNYRVAELKKSLDEGFAELKNLFLTAANTPSPPPPHHSPSSHNNLKLQGTNKKMGNSKTKLYRKKRRNNKKVSKSRKDPQHTEKNKAASASASPSVSEVNENYDSRDLETAAPFKVSIADTYTHPKLIGPRVSDSGYFLRSWTEKGIIPGRTKCRYGHDLEAMAALGVSAVFTHPFPKYEGPPLKNSADNPESWAALGNPYIH